MPRLEIELTSERPDGTWTWRAAGAKQPKGVVESGLVPGGAKVGDVLRAEADIELDGINVTALQAPRTEERKEAERLTLLGRQDEGGVTTSLVEKRSRDRGDRRPRRDRDEPGTGDRRPRRPRSEGAPERAERTRPDRRGERRRPEGEGRGPRPEGRPRGDSRAAGRPERDTRPPAKARPPRFQPGRAHRDAALAALPDEQRPVGEQLLKGGVRAVREALAAQGIDPAPMVTLAENIAPTLRAAEWRDRADAAAADLDAVPLRELRAIVTAAGDAARGEEARELAGRLKEALSRRQDALRKEWTDGIASALEANRPLRALRQATRSPGPGARIPAELAVRLAQAAGAGMAATTPPQRWLDMLEAVAASPVARTVKPEGLPTDAPEELLSKARAAAGAIPALASLLGMSVPPPPPRRAAPPPRRPPPQPRRPEPRRPEPRRPEPAPAPPAPTPPFPASPQATARVEPPPATEPEPTLAPPPPAPEAEASEPE